MSSSSNADKDHPPPYAGIALGITSQDWSELGLGEDPSVAASSDLDVTVERITALILIRIVAWIQPRGTFTDLSTITICRQVLINEEDYWPSSITPEVTQQLQVYVKQIVSRYQTVPYHNAEHCYHVTISTNKLMDMILTCEEQEPRPYTFGFRDDPLMQFVLLFSALIHDVEHQGIPNRQLANEEDVLAVQYNDTSIAEHRSLFLGFSELLKEDYSLLRDTVFPQVQDYRRFRAGVINLVLTTDLASPQQSQVGKSKWKEAFGDSYETVERKVLKHMERRASLASSARGGGGGGPGAHQSHPPPPKASRRMSAQSIMSELTLESPDKRNARDEVGEGLEDDTSVSLTPDTSDVEEDLKQVTEEIVREDGTSPTGRAVKAPPRSKSFDVPSPMVGLTRKPRRRGPGGPEKLTHRSASLDTSAHSAISLTGMASKFHRRLSSMGLGNPGPAASKRYRNTRLGLLRTVDLTGESFETYQQTTPRPSATGAMTSGAVSVVVHPPEEVDQLRETVIMETIMKAADVAHNLQGWDLMAKFSNRLFLELRRAYVQERGDDPQDGWFSNQIGFLEAYLLPLARRLDDTGVFGDTIGASFAQIVEENRDRWMREGMSLTAGVIQEGERQYPRDDTSLQ